MPKEMSQKTASAISSGFRRGSDKGTGLEGVASAIVGFLTDYAEFLEPLSNAIADLLSVGEDVKKPETIKAAVEKYITLPSKTESVGGMGGPQQEEGSILGGLR